MADYDSLLSKATGGASEEVASPQSFDSLLQKAQGINPTPGSDEASSAITTSPMEGLLNKANPRGIPGNVSGEAGQKGIVDTFTSGLARGWGQTKAAIPQLRAVYAGFQGDSEEEKRLMGEADAIQKPYGESDWNLQNIHSPGDFGYWLTEKLGEQGVNFLTMAATGGLGGMGAKLAVQGALARGAITESGARAILMGGAAVPTYALTTALETANTAEEQFQVTGSTQPGRSLAAGAAKGMLELLTPLDIGRALITPGRQLGKSTLRAVGRVTAEEGLTEGAQEAIDIYARKLAEPGYSYFKDGPTLLPSGWDQGMWRLAESAAAGAAVGGIYGAGPAHLEQRRENARDLGTEALGHREVLPPLKDSMLDVSEYTDRASGKMRPVGFEAGDIRGSGNVLSDPYSQGTSDLIPGYYPHMKMTRREIPEFEDQPSVGPVTALRQMVLKPASQTKGLTEVLNSDPRSDALSVNALLGDLKLQEASKNSFLDMLDAATPRYLELANNGDKNRIFTDTEIELNDALNRPQGEKPQYLKVNQNALQPAAITAHMTDLPQPGSERIYFLPNTDPKSKAATLAAYETLYNFTQEPEAQKGLFTNPAIRQIVESQAVKRMYDKILTRGLRVIPSRGKGFYYNGTIDYHGLPQENIKASQRSDQVALLDLTTGDLRFPQVGEEGNFNPGEVLVSIDKNQLKEGVDYTITPSGDMSLTKIPDPSKWVPGIRRADTQILNMAQSYAKFPGVEGERVILAKDKISPENQALGTYIQLAVKDILPGINQILSKIGMENHPVWFYISDKLPQIGDSVAIAYSDQGAIGLSPENISKEIISLGMDRDVGLQNIIMHELGHLVTYHFWAHLPVEHQDGIIYGWNQAKLQGRMGNFDRSLAAVPEDLQQPNKEYWTTLSEFLAEQFRRWGTSNLVPKTILERSFKTGGRKLEEYYREWERKFGRDSALNLSEPHYYFSAAMDYLRQEYRPAKAELKKSLQRNALLSAPQDVLDSPILVNIANLVTKAIDELTPMFPAGLKIHLKERLSPGIHSNELLSNAPAIYNRATEKNLDFIEMALFALKNEDEGTIGSHASYYASHELWHAYERRGLVTPEEIKILNQDIRGNESKILPVQAIALYRKQMREDFEAQKIPPELIEDAIRNGIQEELRAHYVVQFGNTGKAFTEGGRTILARIFAVIEKIRSYLRNGSFQTGEDIRRAFFKGEMVYRQDRVVKQAQSVEWQAKMQLAMPPGEMQFVDLIRPEDIKPDKSWKVGNNTVQAFYELISEAEADNVKTSAPAIIYRWYDSNGIRVGELLLENKGPKGFNVEMVESTQKVLGFNPLIDQMVREAERDLGMKFKLPDRFTASGFKMAQLGEKFGKVEKGLLGLYQKVPNYDGDGFSYISPNKIKQMTQYWGSEVAKSIDSEKDKIWHDTAIKHFKYWREVARKVPRETWGNPGLEKMFALKRNFGRDEVQGSLLRSGQQADQKDLMNSLGFPQGTSQEAFAGNFTFKQKLSQAENARVSGLSFELSAPSSMYSFNLRNIWEWSTGMAGDPRSAKELKNLRHEVDRIGKFTKLLISIDQLGQSNEHIVPLQQLLQNKHLSELLASKWLRQAGETQHLWDKGITSDRQEAITDVLFGLSDMTYRTPAEQKAGTTRLPGGKDEWKNFLSGVPPTPGGELAKFFKDNKLKAKDHEIIRRIQNDFNGFLNDAEITLTDRLRDTFKGSPALLTQAVAKLNADFATYRQKPYFPHMRFGEFTLAVRENGKLSWSNAYLTQRERDAAIKGVRQQFPQGEITRGRIPLHAVEFMGLPAPILQTIKDNLLEEKPGMSPEQISLLNDQKKWIEEFELLHLPDKSFKKRWLPSKGMPGHSMDAMRAYTHYFQSGSRYLSRLAYMHKMRQNVNDLNSRAMDGGIGDYTKAKAIADYAANWLNYYLEAGRDGGKLRAFAALWYLGFSPMAAGMNLTQPLMVTVPKLGADFGVAQGYAAFLKASNQSRHYERGSSEYLKARDEMIAQNKIDLGQAAELASYSEGDALRKLKLGTKPQYFYRKLSSYGMHMFQWAEHYNREVTLRAAWNLAMENPGVKRLQEIDGTRFLEAADLTSRLGMSHKEAIAFLYAKEAIDRTQFEYGKSSDPPFIRGKNSRDLLIFFKYTQNMLWAFGKNGATVHMIFLFALFYGLSGLPGSEDLNEILRLTLRKLFGWDFDLHDKARQFVRDITKGSIFDEVGPDVALHGISRYGFGLGFLPQGWAVPRFDASANGSMGKIIPGFSELMHGVNNDKPTNDMIADAASRAAGAGYGPIFGLLHALNDPGSADSKKWTNVLLPRFMKGIYNANRYGLTQIAGVSTEPYLKQPLAATDQSGAKMPWGRFDPTDPQDIATILAQAAGANPTKVSQGWELQRQINDEKAVYKYRRSTLYVQMQKALEEDSPQARNDVLDAIERYNAEVKDVDPQMVIKGNQLANSLKQRMQQKGMMEAIGSKTKGDVGITNRLLDLFPGVKLEMEKRVR